MPYAVNLYDLMSLQALDPVCALFFPVSALGEVVAANRRKVGQDAVFLAFDDERAAAIVKLVRKRYDKNSLLLYFSKSGRGGWKRI